MPLPPVAWRRLLLVLAVTAALLEAVAGRYGFHRDELYYLVASRHLAWGYDDQPPLVPLLVRAETAVLGDSLRALRTLPLLLTLLDVLLAALCARELAHTAGNATAALSARAQTIAAAATAGSAIVLVAGHLFVTSGVGLCSWSLLLWLVLRVLRTGNQRLWPAVGVVAGVGLEANNLLAVLGLGLAVGAAVAGPRAVFRSPWLYVGVGLAAALWAPNLVWQAVHGWPQLTMARQISGDSDRLKTLLFPLEVAFPPLWIAGWWRLAREPRFRMLAVAAAVVLAVVLLAGGKEYYAVQLLPPLFGAGAVTAAAWRWRPWLVAFAVVYTGVEVVAALPVLPVSAYHWVQPLNAENGETVGWQELAREVAAVRPPGAAVVTENYGEAGALDRYGRPLGLPVPYAPHNGYARFGRPDTAPDVPSVLVGFDSRRLAGSWSRCELATRIDNHRDLDNQEQHKPVWLCEGRRVPWATLWQRLLHYS
jgi:hypothetical protein